MNKFLALALLAVATTPAMATETTRSVIVQTGDLQLSKASDIATLDRRLNKAARSVCATSGSLSLSEFRSASVCRSQALAGVRPSRDALVASARGTELAIAVVK